MFKLECKAFIDLKTNYFSRMFTNILGLFLLRISKKFLCFEMSIVFFISLRRIAALTAESNSRLVKQQNAQRDFLDIEEDYSRFLDFSASPCHSSFLVSPRKFKHGIAREQRSRASQTDLMAFHQQTVAVETDWQIIARR